MDYDAELRSPHRSTALRASGISPTTTSSTSAAAAGADHPDAARISPGRERGRQSTCSAPVVESARQFAAAARVRNVTFEQADARAPSTFRRTGSIAISRFGTMFFANPVAAFTNIGRAMRPGGRLAMMVWQAHERNEWSVSIQRALTGTDVPAAVPGAPRPFSLGDPAHHRADPRVGRLR